MSTLELSLLGTTHIELDSQSVEIERRKASAMLIYLAMTGESHSRDALATMLWPELDQSRARAALRRNLSVLNSALAGDWLLADRESISLAGDSGLWLDVHAFHTHLAVVQEHSVHPDDQPCAECIASLAEAVSLYRDDFLSGFTLRDSPQFDDWQFFHTEELRRQMAGALERLVRWLGTQGEFESAITHARRWLALDTLQEAAHRHLMQLYAWSDQRNAALRQYQECARVLEEELGIAPERETSQLYEAIKAGHQQSSAPVTLVRPETQYAKSGDNYIAYQVIGDGPLDLIFIPGFISHIEYAWQEPRYVRLLQRLSSFTRLIVFDKRGTGLTDRPTAPFALEDHMDDVQAVMDAAGSQRAALLGVSEGGPLSCLFAATYPERTTALILYGIFAKGTKSDDFPWMLTGEQWDRWKAMMVTSWGSSQSLAHFAPSMVDDEHFKKWWAKLLRLGSSPGAAMAHIEMLRQIDIRPILPTIRVPTLVVHRRSDKIVRIDAGRYVTENIPGAQYAELEGDDHLWHVGDSDSILDAVEKFLADIQSTVVPERVLATVLATEASGPDDQRRLDDYQQLMLKTIVRFRGRQADSRNGFLLATFDGPSRAIQCASTISAAAQQMGIEVRAGLHTGECVFVGNDVSGAAVDIAAGVMAHASAGEVMVSNTVKDLVAGSGINFEDRGMQASGGPFGEWHLYRALQGNDSS